MTPVTSTPVLSGFLPTPSQVNEFLIVARKVATAAALILIVTSSNPFSALPILFAAVLLDCALHIDIEKKPHHVTIAELEKRNAQLNATLDQTREELATLRREQTAHIARAEESFSFLDFFNSMTTL